MRRRDLSQAQIAPKVVLRPLRGRLQISGHVTGGVAPLDPRLIAGTPAGVLDPLQIRSRRTGSLRRKVGSRRALFHSPALLLALLVAGSPTQAFAQDDLTGTGAPAATIAPPSGLTAKDHANDTGNAVDLKWLPSPDDTPQKQPRIVRGYDVYRSLADGTEREKLTRLAYGVSEHTDRTCDPGIAYLYEVAAVGADDAQSKPAKLEQPVRGVLQWFDWSRAWFGAIVLVVCGTVVLFTEMAKSGRSVYVRKIAALNAIEEAVGRATEMGRPCLFVPGMQDINETPTVAGIAVLSEVAKIAAGYDAPIEVPTSRSLVMTAARETVQAAYLSAGHPEAYNDDRIYYVTEEQFAYVAYLTGYMVREKPAACFYMGTFFAESLILGETAIQIAGTAEAAQLPFFVAACDYTLIGEELFAASAYLSGEPHQLGSLKGQDVGKTFAGILLTAGSLVATLAVMFPEWSAPQSVLAFLQQTVLGKGAPG